MAKTKTFLEKWKAGDKIFNGSPLRPISPYQAKPSPMTGEIERAHHNFVGGLLVAGPYLISSSEDCRIKIWDRATLSLLHEIPEPAPANHLALSPDGKTFVVGSDEYSVKVYEVGTWRLLLEMEGHHGYVSKAVYDHSGGGIVSISKDGKAAVWDARTGRRRHWLEGHEDWVYSVATHPARPFAITGSLNSSLKVWNTETGELLHDLVKGSMLFYVMGMTVGGGNYSDIGNRKSTNHAIWTRDSRVCTFADDIVVWDEDTWEMLWRSDELSKGIKSALYSEEHRAIITGSGSIDAWDLDTGRRLFSHVGHGGKQIYSCASEGDDLYTADEKGNIKAWSIPQLLENGEDLQHSWAVYGMCVTPDGERIITGSFDKSTIVWDGRGVALRQFTGFRSSVEAIGPRPGKEGQYLVAGDGKVSIIDVYAVEKIQDVTLDEKLVQFSDVYWLDSDRFIGCSLSYRPRLVDLAAGKVSVLKTPCSFTRHFELDNGLVAFTTYPSEPLDEKYDKDKKRAATAERLDVGMGGYTKEYQSVSPLVLFDPKEMQVVNELWHSAPPSRPHKKDEKNYSHQVLAQRGNRLIMQHTDSDILVWDLEMETCERLLHFKNNRDGYGTGFHIKGDTLHIADNKSDKIITLHLPSGEVGEYALPGVGKHKPWVDSDFNFLAYKAENKLFIVDFDSKEVVFQAEFPKIRSLFFQGDRLVVGGEEGRVFVFEWKR